MFDLRQSYGYDFNNKKISNKLLGYEFDQFEEM